jgi:HK97 family phage prohead protease
MTTTTHPLGTFETRLAVPASEGGIDLRAAAAGSGEFEGMLCRFNTADSYGTHFVPGCFTAGGLDERLYALLWMHDPFLPGATFTGSERTDEGLWIEGQYDDTQQGQDMRVRAKSGSAAELSVGFIWLDSDEDDENAITKARLVEGSQITARMASVPGSQISAVRAASLGGMRLDTQGGIVTGPTQDQTMAAMGLVAARARLIDLQLQMGVELS